MDFDYEGRVKKVIKTAGKTLVLFSGGSKIGDEDLLERAKICMKSGATGLIWGRNLWQREWDDAMRVIDEIKKIMKSA
jgi:class I fructose-bisphosphate aldolase